MTHLAKATETAMCLAYQQGRRFTSLAADYHVGTSTLFRVLKRNGIPTLQSQGIRPIRLTKQQLTEIVDEYRTNSTSCEVMAVRYGVSGWAIRHHLKRAGLKLKRSPVPQHTPERARKNAEAIRAAWADPIRREQRLAQVRSIGFKPGTEHRLYKHGKKVGVERGSVRYQKFRKAVLQRDGRTCVICDSNDRPHVHHILAWAKFPELRYTVSNGITLCQSHHLQIEAHRKRTRI